MSRVGGLLARKTKPGSDRALNGRVSMKVRLLSAGFVLAVLVLGGACAPEVGSDAWCQAMDEKPKGDWTANEAADYTKHCLLR